MEFARRLDLFAAAAGAGSVPHRVSAVLAVAGADAPDSLDVRTRGAGLAQVAVEMGTWPANFVARCGACGALSDLSVEAAEVLQAWPDGVSGLTGVDEIAALEGHLNPADLALRLNVAEGELAEELSARLPEGKLKYTCPACQETAHFALDLLRWIADQSREATEEVGQLAAAFGWSEAQVAALPEARRRAYLAQIGAD